MSGNEKFGWLAYMIPFGLLFMVSLGGFLGSGGDAFWVTGFVVAGAVVAVMFVTWLFRLTYLAGRRRGDA